MGNAITPEQRTSATQHGGGGTPTHGGGGDPTHGGGGDPHRPSKGLLIGLAVLVVVLGGLCAFLAYNAGYFGGTGTWKQQFDRMVTERDFWKGKYSVEENQLLTMTQERDRWKNDYDAMESTSDSWQSKYLTTKQEYDSLLASQSPSMSVTNSQIYETTRGIITVHHDLNVKCDVVNYGGSGTATVSLVVKDRPTGSTLVSNSRSVKVMKGATEQVSWYYEDMLNGRQIAQLDVSLKLQSQSME